MSFQPKVIVTDEVAAQILALQLKKDELTLTRDHVAARLHTIEHVLKENEVLEKRAKELVTESVQLHLEEWAKIKVLYPEVRLGILQKTLDFAAPADQKK